MWLLPLPRNIIDPARLLRRQVSNHLFWSRFKHGEKSSSWKCLFWAATRTSSRKLLYEITSRTPKRWSRSWWIWEPAPLRLKPIPANLKPLFEIIVCALAKVKSIKFSGAYLMEGAACHVRLLADDSSDKKFINGLIYLYTAKCIHS